MNYSEAVRYLYGVERVKGSRLGLANINSLLRKIGNPHKRLKVIHVAGTNAKGSVCSMISSILEESGYKVGLYTSPHLVDFRERFQINKRKIDAKDFLSCFTRVKKHITGQTCFEITTAIAFLYFAEKGVDYLVLEVGLGGRLDATNVVVPLLSIITNIDLEHIQVLGSKIEDIAYEKAGIIKPNVPCVTGTGGKALKVIRSVCRQKNSRLYLNEKYQKTNGKYDINGHKNLTLGLRGDFQLENSSVAVTAIDVLRGHYHLTISENNIKKGLKNVKWPGRFEFVRKNLIVDCAHNEAGMRVLSKEIAGLKNENRFRRLILVIGIMKDKDKKGMLKHIEKFSDVIIITRPKVERSESIENLGMFVKKGYTGIPDVKKALKHAMAMATKKDLVLAAGSCYLAGEALASLRR